MASSESSSQMKIVNGDAGYVLEDVPHLSDYVPDLPVFLFFSLFLFSPIFEVTFAIYCYLMMLIFYFFVDVSESTSI